MTLGVVLRIGDILGFVRVVEVYLVCFLVFCKSWFFWVDVISNRGREFEVSKRICEVLAGGRVF